MSESLAIIVLVVMSLVVAVGSAFALVLFLRRLKKIREDLEKAHAARAEAIKKKQG